MSLGLILGRAGSGKTETCIRQIEEKRQAGGKEEYILLTPEQATFANEKRVLDALGNAAGMQVKALSFRRFVYLVLQETGGGLLPAIDSVGKSMALRAILERLKPDLIAFRRVWDKRGFVNRLTDLLDELRAYRIEPGDLASRLGGPDEEGRKPTDLADKLGDIEKIYSEYEAFLAQGRLDLAGELSLLCQKLPSWPGLKRSCFWFDGFHGFTPAEFDVIRSLLAAGRPLKVTLNLPEDGDGRVYEEEELFYPTWETARDLRQICRKNGYAMEPSIYMGEPGGRRFAGSPDLTRLEKAFAGKTLQAGDGAPEPYSSGTCAVRLAGCGDMRREVERLAVEIQEAARGGGLRYKDMAILLRRPEAYQHLIQSIFPSYGIPYFYDGPKTLRHHPLICLFRETAAILKDRWNTGTLMAYMKTGFSGLSDNQGYALENYCLAHGVQRMHWESHRPWRFTPPEDPEHESIDRYMEKLRQKLWTPIEELRKDTAEAASVKEITGAVYRHLVRLKAEGTCSRLANEAAEQGEPETAQIHQRAWRELMKLFDQTAVYLESPRGAGGAEAAALAASVWESGLEALEMAALPPSLDQVTVCSMDRSRSPLAKEVWIPGANEGVIPAGFRDDGLLSLEERQWIAGRDVRLAPDSRRRLFSESYLIYIALTRASESLHISYARADAQGGRQTASALLEQICGVFPGITVEESEPAIPRRLITPPTALPYLGLAMQNVKAGMGDGTEEANGYTPGDWTGLWRYVFHWFGSRPAYRRDLERIRLACDLAPLGRPLPATLAEELFGRIIRTSITRLEQYQACPFAHFLAYGLALAPRDEYEVQPPEIGNFFHDSLQALMEEVNDRSLSLGTLAGGELDAMVETVADRQLERMSHDIFLSSAWYRSLAGNLLRILQSSARAMAYQDSRGSFQPVALEADFGFEREGSLPPLSLDLGEGRRILLRGRIDRIDRAVPPGAVTPYLRVVDYKSGHMDLALYEIYHGLKLQLILYMEAALAAFPGSAPAGLFYYQIHDPVLTAANIPEARDGEWQKEKLLKTQPLRGYLLRDRKIIEMMDRDYAASLFLPVSELKSGDFGRRSKLLGAESFRLLGAHGLSVIKRTGRKIMEGDISLTPYQSGGKSACDYCPYGGVCRFDTAVPGHSYRWLPALSDEAILDRLKRGAEKGLEE